ncbi:putative metal-binding motif-containing protein [Kangiella sediminilitoris]|uniref:Uncharacterized protein n=1 Tax=Kangiella sediminilitoris TaxID=1144748 RepID=A0A1B3BAC3_9GAMM|nr:putative metal-binding motif-containing protein [Kangiella sediminilitoris]AOE49718.1 hypothetical protein KS2013_997 [Kangiella sediminilitoris]
MIGRKKLLLSVLGFIVLSSVAIAGVIASQEFKKIDTTKVNSVKAINPTAIKKVKDIGKVEMLSGSEYRKKLNAHNLKVKSKAVKTSAQANTRLRTQNTEFDTTTYDCDDSKRAVNIGAQEICDGIDNNCNGDIDEGVSVAYYLDADSDLWGDASKVYYACSLPDGYSQRRGDCNDRSSAINPSAQEIPGNNIDENCDRVK